MPVEIRFLGPGDADVLRRVADDVFDHAVDAHWARVFLDDPRHHLVVAVDDGQVVGFVSAVDYVHPDQPPQLFIDEVGVAGSHQRRGIARRLMEAMLAHGRALGCTEAWVGTEADNAAARALYQALGGAAEPFVLYAWPLAPSEDRTGGGDPDQAPALDELGIEIHCPACGTEMVHDGDSLVLADAPCGAMLECGRCGQITSWRFTLRPFTLRQMPNEWGGRMECG